MNLNDKSKAIGIVKKSIESIADGKLDINDAEAIHSLAMLIVNNLEVNMTTTGGIRVRDNRTKN